VRADSAHAPAGNGAGTRWGGLPAVADRDTDRQGASARAYCWRHLVGGAQAQELGSGNGDLAARGRLCGTSRCGERAPSWATVGEPAGGRASGWQRAGLSASWTGSRSERRQLVALRRPRLLYPRWKARLRPLRARHEADRPHGTIQHRSSCLAPANKDVSRRKGGAAMTFVRRSGHSLHNQRQPRRRNNASHIIMTHARSRQEAALANPHCKHTSRSRSSRGALPCYKDTHAC
jgi:hypothetical protein